MSYEMEIRMNKKFLDNITEFIFIEHEPKPADIIFVPGNGYSDMAIRAARLWNEKYAPFILISGKYAKHVGAFRSMLKEENPYSGEYETECDFLYTILKGERVAPEAIIRENEATFTYENAVFSKRLTDERSLSIHKAIICCNAYHGRRCLMYYQLLYPDTEFLVCAIDTGIDRNNWHRTEKGIEVVLGEVERCGSQFHEIIKGCNQV